MVNLLFALIGLLVGGLINVLADVLPQRAQQEEPVPLHPYCPQCRYQYGPAGWLAIGRRLWGGGHCPQCGLPTRIRAILVEVVTALLFALLPTFISVLPNLIVNSFYVAVLILVIVIDLEHRLILDVVTFPVTVLALLASMVVTPEENTFLLALVGAIVGYLLFYVVYWLARLLYGPGAIGAGDVKLAMAMGAMLGFHRIFFALILAILLGGIGSLVLLLTRRVGRHSYAPYGQYLAIAAIVMLIWGTQVVEWYTN